MRRKEREALVVKSSAWFRETPGYCNLSGLYQESTFAAQIRHGALIDVLDGFSDPPSDVTFRCTGKEGTFCRGDGAARSSSSRPPVSLPRAMTVDYGV